MALIAIDAVIDIPLHTLVVLVGLRLGVTNGAREHRIVRWIRVAVVARGCSPMLHGEPGVVEVSSLPRIRGVAGQAGSRKSSRLMVGVGCAVVVLLVAGITVSRKVGVVIVHMARAAGHLKVRAGQRPAGGAVIELAIGPQDGVMTHLALLRESCRLMRRIVGVVVVGQMAGHTRCVGQFVVVIHVAL